MPHDREDTRLRFHGVRDAVNGSFRSQLYRHTLPSRRTIMRPVIVSPSRTARESASSSRHAFVLALFVTAACAYVLSARAQSSDAGSVPGAAGEPYPHMPSIAPIGEKIGKYMDVPAAAVGPAIDPAKGYRLQDLGGGLHMITDNAYQSMFLVYDERRRGDRCAAELRAAHSGRDRGGDRQADHARGLQPRAHRSHRRHEVARRSSDDHRARRNASGCSRARRIRTGRCRP